MLDSTNQSIRAKLQADIDRIEASGSGADSLDADPSEELFRKIERLACRREQSSVALLRRFTREGYACDAAQQAVDRALACGLIDDDRYADVLVRSRLSQGKGRKGIAAELEDLGIDANSVEAFVDSEMDEPEEIERALTLLMRKPPRSKKPREAAYRRLVQKGYSTSVASSAARQWHELNK